MGVNSVDIHKSSRVCVHVLERERARMARWQPDRELQEVSLYTVASAPCELLVTTERRCKASWLAGVPLAGHC